jgi:hypothetical protein
MTKVPVLRQPRLARADSCVVPGRLAEPTEEATGESNSRAGAPRTLRSRAARPRAGSPTRSRSRASGARALPGSICSWWADGGSRGIGHRGSTCAVASCSGTYRGRDTRRRCSRRVSVGPSRGMLQSRRVPPGAGWAGQWSGSVWVRQISHGGATPFSADGCWVVKMKLFRARNTKGTDRVPVASCCAAGWTRQTRLSTRATTAAVGGT